MKNFTSLSAFLFPVCLSGLMFPLLTYGQQTTFTGVSGFVIPEKDNPEIGFTAVDVNHALFSREKIAVYGGMRLIAATTGKRGGYFAFGYDGECVFRPQKQFQYGINAALLAGGGAAAPDKDGWLVQTTLFGQYQWENGLSLRTGLNYAYVSSGMIKGFSPLLGMNWRLHTTGNTDLSSGSKMFVWNAVFGEVGIGTFRKEHLGFIGSGAVWKYGSHMTGDVSIHALANTYGGYMQTLFSGGPALSVKSFSISPSLIIGMGGGGSVKTIGGALYGAQLGMFYSGRRFHAGVEYQFVEAFSKQFHYDGLFLSIGKTFNEKHTPLIGWDLITKAYLGKDGFGNIGARFTGFEYKKLRLTGATYWAFTHDRGAYAEGLFEAILGAPDEIPLYAVVSGGAGAGAGINRKTASLIYAAGLGYASPNKRFPVNIEAAYWRGGNIPNWSVSLAWRIKHSH